MCHAHDGPPGTDCHHAGASRARWDVRPRSTVASAVVVRVAARDDAGTPVAEATGDKEDRAMERVIETMGSGVGDGIGWLAEHYVLFGAFLVLWVAFAIGLLVNQGSLDQAWATIRALPIVVQLVIWLLFLPVMAGLWIWEASGWDVLVRLVLVIVLAGWNLLVLLPSGTQATPAS